MKLLPYSNEYAGPFLGVNMVVVVQYNMRRVTDTSDIRGKLLLKFENAHRHFSIDARANTSHASQLYPTTPQAQKEATPPFLHACFSPVAGLGIRMFDSMLTCHDGFRKRAEIEGGTITLHGLTIPQCNNPITFTSACCQESCQKDSMTNSGRHRLWS